MIAVTAPTGLPQRYNVTFNRDIFFPDGIPFTVCQSLRSGIWQESIDITQPTPDSLRVTPFGSGTVTRTRYFNPAITPIEDADGMEAESYDLPTPSP